MCSKCDTEVLVETVYPFLFLTQRPSGALFSHLTKVIQLLGTRVVIYYVTTLFLLKPQLTVPMIEQLTFHQICDRYVEAYTRSFGETKFKTIADKIWTSNKVSGFISKSRYEQWRPNPQTILDVLHTIPYFLLCRNETIALGGLLFIVRWNSEANESAQMTTEEQLKMMALFILEDQRCTHF
jgi:hypothetical protein